MVDDAAAGDGHGYFEIQELLRRNFIQVCGKDDEVGQHSRSDFAFDFFFEFRVGGSYRVVAEAIVHIQFFLGLPAMAGAALRQFAGDAGINSAQRVDGFDGKVGAEGEVHSGAFHAAPGVSAEDAAGADAVGGPTLVGEQMCGLHGGDDVHFGELSEIVGRDDLGVFDAVAAVAVAIGGDDGGVRIKGDVVGAVADGVEGELKAVMVALDGEGFQLVRTGCA